MIKKKLLIIYNFFLFFGLDLIRLLKSLRFIFFKYPLDLISFYKKNQNSENIKLFPALDDSSHNIDKIYFNQDLIVAKKIFENRPKNHLDIGSRIDGFVAHLATFRKVYVMDIRPLKIKDENIIFFKKDLMKNNIETKFIENFDSVSSLHALEHFGLGRYGDRLDPEGYIKGIKNLQRYLKKDGLFYLSLPIGFESKIFFNAHRVFTINKILNIFSKDFKFVSLELLNELGDKIPSYDLEGNLTEISFEYGCGIFTFQKK